MSEAPIATIMKDLIKPDKVHETHISYVFIKGDDVYKAKKSVNFGFLDFSQKKARHRYCILEKELNSRFCEGIYEDVLKVARKEKYFSIEPHSSTLLTVDYLVKMKRIPEENFLSTRVNDGKISADDMKRIGKEIAELLKNIETPEADAIENGSFDIIKFNCDENFIQTEGFKGGMLNAEYLDYIKVQTDKFLYDNKELFDRRTTSGLVKDGHGDLRLEHVFFYENDQIGHIGLIDCIEFNKRFRFNDVINDFAFLATELDSIGRVDLADAATEGFLSVFDDEDSVKLLNFYKCYRAYIRAKVTCFLLAEKGEEWEMYETKLAEARAFIDTALIYAMNMNGLKTVISYGLMAGGKSKNSKAFAKRFPVYYIGTDEERKRLAGLGENEKVHVDFGAGLYSKENSLKLYAYLGKQAEAKKKTGRMSIVDGSFGSPEYLDKFLDGYSFDYKKVKFSAPDEEIIRRLEKRMEKDVSSDGRLEIYPQQKASFVDPGADKEIETLDPAEKNVEKLLKYLIDEA